MRLTTRQSGLTMLEAIISLGIVMVGMLGVASLSRQNIVAQNNNRNFLLAAALSQEAAELIRNQRDTNQRRNWNWQTGDGIDGNTDIVQDDHYTIQYDGEIDDTADNIGEDEARLFLTPGGYYVHDSAGNSPTPFRRLVTIIDDDGPDFDFLEYKIEVVWNERGNDFSYQIDGRLYDWW